MKSSISYIEINNILFETFPNFENSISETKGLLEDNPSVLLSFFANWIYYNFHHVEEMGKVCELLDRMHKSEDENVSMLLNDFMLDLYSRMKESGRKTDLFIEQLSLQTQQRYYENVELWERGNNIKN